MNRLEGKIALIPGGLPSCNERQEHMKRFHACFVYEGFRQSVFAGGQRFRQRFYNIRIEQHGALAQVSLDFVTEQGSGKRGSETG